MQGSIRISLSAALAPTFAFALFAQAARADDADRLKAAVAAASANVKSLVVDTTTKQGAVPAAMHEVAVFPDRMSVTMTAGRVTIETRIVGDAAFVNMGGGGWRKGVRQLGDLRKAAMGLADTDQRITVLPDVVIAGATYRRYRTEAALAASGGEATTICLVDAKTSYLAACDNANVHIVFSHYNDPANAVELPVVDPQAPPLTDPRAPAIPPIPDKGPLRTPTAAGPRAPQGG